MKNRDDFCSVSAPARICLMGEHQDYYGLASITMAINLRITLMAKPRTDHVLSIHLPDIKGQETIHLQEEIRYQHTRDYLRSGLKILQQQGLQLPRGYDVNITGDIPLAKGISSSSAFAVLWIKFLTHAAGWAHYSNDHVAYDAYRAEVLEFNEAGGMMDQYTSAYGGMLHIDCADPFTVTPLNRSLNGFILGDTRTIKDTQGVLSSLKNQVLTAVQEIKPWVPDFSFRNTPITEVTPWLAKIKHGSPRKLIATLTNRDLTKQTLQLFLDSSVQDNALDTELANLMNHHHRQLRDGLAISTPEMENLVRISRGAGALACKVSGSGRGGFVLIFAPGKEKSVMNSLKMNGYDALPVAMDSGVTVSN